MLVGRSSLAREGLGIWTRLRVPLLLLIVIESTHLPSTAVLPVAFIALLRNIRMRCFLHRKGWFGTLEGGRAFHRWSAKTST